MPPNEDVLRGDRFVEVGARVDGRTMEVLYVLRQASDGVTRPTVVCRTRGGKATLIALDRLLCLSRYTRVARETPAPADLPLGAPLETGWPQGTEA